MNKKCQQDMMYYAENFKLRELWFFIPVEEVFHGHITGARIVYLLKKGNVLHLGSLMERVVTGTLKNLSGVGWKTEHLAHSYLIEKNCIRGEEIVPF